MRLDTFVARGFRNLADIELELPHPGVVLLGANGQGKTNLLEAIYYPVLFRSFRGALDSEVARFGHEGFRLEAGFMDGSRPRHAATTFRLAGRRKRNELDGAPLERLTDGAGAWLAVTFQPDDVRLAGGSASGRRMFLDRTLALASRPYFRALARYRSALAQRNASLRGARPEAARAFDEPLARSGAQVVAERLQWVAGASGAFGLEVAALGERGEAGSMEYAGREALSDPANWPALLDESWPRDLGRRATSVGPHRDDLRLLLGGRPLREYGSTGQQRTAAIALKLIELETLRTARGVCPALLLDDVFAELDAERQQGLMRRLRHRGEAQVFLTSPRQDELPPNLDLPVWRVDHGKVEPA